MNHQLYLAEFDFSGSYGPLIWAFIISFALAACISGLWAWWRAPAQVQNLLRKNGIGLVELKKYFHLRLSDWFLSFAIAFIPTIILFSIIFYLLLKNPEYEVNPLLLMLSNSMMIFRDLLGGDRPAPFGPIPFGMLLSVLAGYTLGRPLGLAFGKKSGSKRVLLTSRIRNSVKS